MTDFVVKNALLSEFLKKASCEGTIKISQTEKITGHFFESFYLEATENRLEIKSIDSEGSTLYAFHKLYDVEVREAGKFAVTDVKILTEILSLIPSSRKIRFTYDNSGVLAISTDDEGQFKGFTVRRDFTLMPNELKEYKENVIKFIEIHKFKEDGSPYIQIGDQIGNYETVLSIPKKDLMDITNQSLKLTKVQLIKFTMNADGEIRFDSGEENSDVKGMSRFSGLVENPIEVSESFNNLQPIIPSLFEDVKIYMRVAGSDGKLKWWIKSKKKNMEMNFATGCI